jgi:hypothetical protein
MLALPALSSQFENRAELPALRIPPDQSAVIAYNPPVFAVNVVS